MQTATISNFLPPNHLEHFVTYNNEAYFREINESVEWRGQIISSTKNKQFRIKYYGELFEHFIVATDFSESRVIAEDVDTGEQILLFDGCKHGYNAMFCDNYSDEKINNRPTGKVYKDANNNEMFEVLVTAYYGIDYDDEMEDFLNTNQQIELFSGEVISEDYLKRNGFDFFGIEIINEIGQKTEIVSNELA